ncbi:MAG: sn-glycerol-3-phosphate import ATP-binding protein UgpC [Gammaproteobacteria bacterium]|nr:sn-glycerol-3-phosphate import ATP-binding protein UgpC [Gammaproteobacteria bacterium]
MAEIQLDNLTKCYGSVEVLHHIEGHINDGEFIVIVGPSGCGKSTLLRMIAGLETVSSGEISIGGQVVNNQEPADRDIAMVFQNYALYPHMTVAENMSYGLKIRKLPKDEIRQRVQQAADILEISEFLDRKPRQLSGGQRQRVAMGRAIVREPAVFLFDEPLSNLDAKLRVQMRLEIRKLQQDLGLTSIYVTHDQVEAMTLGDRLMVLNDGYVEQFGTPIELYQHPETVFVAGFIGSPSMNFIPVSRIDGKAPLRLPNGVITGFSGHVEHANLLLGIRPEHFVEAPAGAFQLQVEMLEHLGATTLVHGILEGTDIALVVSLEGFRDIDIGSILNVDVEPDSLHFFNPETQKRIG